MMEWGKEATAEISQTGHSLFSPLPHLNLHASDLWEELEMVNARVSFFFF